MSRAGDPQLHTHVVVPCLARCADRASRRLEPKRLFEAQRLIGALYHCALAAELRALGLTLIHGDRCFTLIGVFEGLCAVFSRRAREIATIAGPNASSARRAVVARASRKAINGNALDIAGLAARWQAQAAKTRLPRTTAVDHVTQWRMPPSVKSVAAVDDDVLREALSCFRNVQELTCCALIAEIAAAVSSQGCDPRRILGEALQPHRLIPCGQRRGQPFYTTAEAIDRERELLAYVAAACGAGHWRGIDFAPACHPPRTAEEWAIVHALDRSPIAPLEMTPRARKRQMAARLAAEGEP